MLVPFASRLRRRTIPTFLRVGFVALLRPRSDASSEIYGEDIEGTCLNSDYRGKVVAADFGDSSPHCVASPHEALVEHERQTRALLGVNSDHNRAEVAKISYDRRQRVVVDGATT